MSPFLFTTALMIFVSGIPLRGFFFFGGGGGVSEWLNVEVTSVRSLVVFLCVCAGCDH